MKTTYRLLIASAGMLCILFFGGCVNAQTRTIESDAFHTKVTETGTGITWPLSNIAPIRNGGYAIQTANGDVVLPTATPSRVYSQLDNGTIIQAQPVNGVVYPYYGAQEQLIAPASGDLSVNLGVKPEPKETWSNRPGPGAYQGPSQPPVHYGDRGGGPGRQGNGGPGPLPGGR